MVVSGGRRCSLPADEGLEVEAALRAERDRLIEAGRKAAADTTAGADWTQAAGSGADVADDATAEAPTGRTLADVVRASGGGSVVVVAVVG